MYSPYIVPVAGIILGGVAIGFGSWRKVREKELAHQLRMKELELEALRLKASKGE
jgi:hypothetical protein